MTKFRFYISRKLLVGATRNSWAEIQHFEIPRQSSRPAELSRPCWVVPGRGRADQCWVRVCLARPRLPPPDRGSRRDSRLPSSLSAHCRTRSLNCVTAPAPGLFWFPVRIRTVCWPHTGTFPRAGPQWPNTNCYSALCQELCASSGWGLNMGAFDLYNSEIYLRSNVPLKFCQHFFIKFHQCLQRCWKSDKGLL